MNLVRRNWLKATVRFHNYGYVPAHQAVNLDASDRRKIVINAEKMSRAQAAIKPGRVLGGVWMDQFVAQRQGINLCEICVRMKGPWWKDNGYKPDWNPYGAKRGDCDGCGEILIRLTPFYPEESFNELKIRTDPRYVIKGTS
tara:strand:+ start:2301 stop:2726 length:426 start_codon:yes stop_codon:yes gene_type:complete